VADEPNHLYPEYHDDDRPGMLADADLTGGETELWYDGQGNRYTPPIAAFNLDGKWIPIGLTESGVAYEVESTQFGNLSEAIAERTMTATFEMPMDGTTWDLLSFLMGDEIVRAYREEYYAELAWENEGGAIR